MSSFWEKQDRGSTWPATLVFIGLEFMGSPIDGGVVMVTGASAGIGEALARRLASRVKTLVVVARRRDRLDKLATELREKNVSLEVLVEECDLEDGAAREALCERVLARCGVVDVLINNAGLGDMTMFDRAEWSKTERMIELNVTALAHLTHRFLRGMIERGRGGILNVSSGFGLVALPGFAGYVGTKHFVTGFTETLRLDLVGTGVRVTQVCPGPVATEFMDNLGTNLTGQNPPKFIELSAAECARQTVKAFDRNRALVIPGFWIRWLTYFGMWTPKWLFRLVFGALAPWLRKRQLAASNASR